MTSRPAAERETHDAGADSTHMWLAWLLRVVLIVIVVWAIWRFLSGVVEGAMGQPQVSASQGVPLVRDPVCGTYVVRSRAVTLTHGNSVEYFCSDRCRHAYAKR